MSAGHGPRDKKAKRKRSPSPVNAKANKKGANSAKGQAGNKANNKKSKMDEEDVEEDLTGEMDDPTPENSINEVKVTPANTGRPDMQPQRGAGTYMDLDEADLQGKIHIFRVTR